MIFFAFKSTCDFFDFTFNTCAAKAEDGHENPKEDSCTNKENMLKSERHYVFGESVTFGFDEPELFIE
tara:strand:- start:415 stop:618 length:204 start_codon:yes stop_codon:yes gene_type:complete